MERQTMIPNGKPLEFKKETVTAKIVDPLGNLVDRPVEIRTDPITGRTGRIAFSRSHEKESGTDTLPKPPPHASDTTECPFCRPRVMEKTPRFPPDFAEEGRFFHGESILFPNMYPYGSHSAVSIFDDNHFVEIGRASKQSYTNSFINCTHYLTRLREYDPGSEYIAITQNFLPSAGGSLLHPHLQVHACGTPSNHQRFIIKRCLKYYEITGGYIYSDYVAHEKLQGERYIGNTGPWEWMAAFVPEAFFEIWAILPDRFSFRDITEKNWDDLSRGVMNIQQLFRNLNRNSYNLGMLFWENENSRLEIKLSIMVRSNYTPWVRNDFSSYELILGDMATFTSPEWTAENARRFWEHHL